MVIKMFCESCTKHLNKKEIDECDKKYHKQHYYCSGCRKTDY